MDDYISRQWLMKCVNEGWIKFDTEKDENRFIHLIRDIAPSIQPEPRWIPCDREPELAGDYLLYRPHFWGENIGQITVCYWNGKQWSDNYKSDAERFLPVVPGMAWMWVQEPYRKETVNGSGIQ